MNPWNASIVLFGMACTTILAWGGKISLSSDDIHLMVVGGLGFVAGWVMPQANFVKPKETP